MAAKKADLIQYDHFNRRMFIKAVGGGLVAIPLLESFMPSKAYAAGTSVKRFISVTTPDYLPYAYTAPHELQKVIPTSLQSAVAQKTDPFGWKYRQASLQALINQRGQISDLIDSKFNSLASQMLIYRGLDYPGRIDHGRAASMGNTLATQLGQKYKTIKDFGNYTIDEIIANSPNFYPNGRQAITKDIVRLGGSSISTNRIDGTGDGSRGFGIGGHNAGLTYNGNLKIALDSWFSSSGNQNSKKSIVDRILANVNTIRSRSGMGAADKIKMEEFQDKMSQLSQKLSESGAATCSSTTLTMPDQDAKNMGNLVDGAERVQNYYSNLSQLLGLAIKCGITKIATVGVASSILSNGQASAHGGSPRTWHLDYGHGGNLKELLALNKWIVDNFIYSLANELNVDEGSGSTYLDNTGIYFSSECSVGHGGEGMAGFLIGGSNMINTGNFFDYGDYERHTVDSYQNVHEAQSLKLQLGVGLPINRLFVSIMRSMGLNSSEYLNKYGSSGSGFGFWPGTYEKGFESFLGEISRINRDESLPGFLKV